MARANAKYAKLVQPLRLRTEIADSSFRDKIADFSLVYDGKIQPKIRRKSRKRSSIT